MSARELITDHLDLWTGAVTTKSTASRGTSSGKRGKIELAGIKKLRELILELAVRGKLVEQDPDDEPASVLLERIAEEKAELVKEGKIKKPKKLPEITEAEKPFELPDGWTWVKFGNLYPTFQNGASSRGDTGGEQVEVIRLADINNLEITRENPRILPISRTSIEKYGIKKGDILIIRVNGSADLVGQLIPVRDNSNSIYCDHFIRVRISEDLASAEYLCLLGSSNLFRSEIKELFVSTAGQKTVNQKHIGSLPAPLPPLAEQHRIVEKVDELMALCDRLEEQVGDQLEAHEVLVDTLLDALTRSADADEVAENWARTAEHFDTLFTTEASIDKLKQAVLQLAVMGRLVKQDPNDEPASVLLEKIAEEKARLVKEGKIKKRKKLPEITEEEKPFEAPPSWAFTRVEVLYELQNGYAFKSEWFSQSGIKLLRNINISHGETDWSECALLPESMASDYQRFSLKNGDLVISLDRPIISTGLKYSIIRKKDLPCLLLQRVARFQPYLDTIATRYLEHWLNSKMFTSSINPGRSNGVPHISTGQIGKVIFSLPPKDEQHRIVDKVDELMALCDHLKARLGEAGETRTQLAEAVVEQAVS